MCEAVCEAVYVALCTPPSHHRTSLRFPCVPCFVSRPDANRLVRRQQEYLKQLVAKREAAAQREAEQRAEEERLAAKVRRAVLRRVKSELPGDHADGKHAADGKDDGTAAPASASTTATAAAGAAGAAAPRRTVSAPGNAAVFQRLSAGLHAQRTGVEDRRAKARAEAAAAAAEAAAASKAKRKLVSKPSARLYVARVTCVFGLVIVAIVVVVVVARLCVLAGAVPWHSHMLMLLLLLLLLPPQCAC